MATSLPTVQKFLILLSGIASFLVNGIMADGYLYNRKTLVNSANVGEYISLNTTIKSLVSNSKTECVRACVGLGRQCGAVEFDELSGNCTAGTEVVRSSGVPVSQQKPSTVFYSRPPGTCDVQQGFKYVAGSEEVVCLFVSDTKVKRGAAKEICANKGGNLYTMKSIDKFNILEQNRNGYEDYGIWVGLKEGENDGIVKTFFWDDGVQFMRNDSLWDIFWIAGRPSPTVAPNCVQARNDGGKMKHLESYCSYLKIYACEMTPN